jgi:hypothetical protein
MPARIKSSLDLADRPMESVCPDYQGDPARLDPIRLRPPDSCRGRMKAADGQSVRILCAQSQPVECTEGGMACSALSGRQESFLRPPARRAAGAIYQVSGPSQSRNCSLPPRIDQSESIVSLLEIPPRGRVSKASRSRTGS